MPKDAAKQIGSTVSIIATVWLSVIPLNGQSQPSIELSPVLPAGGGVPTAVQDGYCTPEAFGPPTIVSGQYGGLEANPGETVQTWVILQDATVAQDAWGNTIRPLEIFRRAFEGAH